MTMSLNLIDALGWISGALVMVSAAPNIIANIRTQTPQPSISRDFCQLAGNTGWAVYGVLTDALPITVMCGVNAGLMSILLFQHCRRQRDFFCSPHDPNPRSSTDKGD